MNLSKIKIESGIPIPQKYPRTSKLMKIVGQMKLGDSVCFKNQKDATLFYLAICRCFSGNRSGQVAKVENGFRVWRIK